MNQTQFDFKNRVVIVTGASSGIGKATARHFALCGAKVVVSDVNELLGSEVARSLEKDHPGQILFKTCNVADENQVKSLIEYTVQRFGRLDIAVNNAGVEGKLGPITQCEPSNWDKVINTNLQGVFHCMKNEIPEMLKVGGGAIVNVSSIAGLIGFAGLPAYVASKHGVLGLTKTAAVEFAGKNIRVNAVCPGPINTPMLSRLMDTTPGFRESVTAGVPEGRIGEPEDVANAILFLCTEQSRYITGQALAVDGGYVSQ